ncbi:LOW QUALITY PROTEIN: hypothetical protein PHMEG_0005383 [Phytophthora megakarya]|uniref:Reverse transcriptase RNase H-like domain-containing protein n=1 Tax=Phytophthora megakarya TaxID=4795 RepID=A0A225WRG6_9STRA|nr:LOW QUALITY PROTEIN: hypothetical protein PHMEG_0005383 [Phytophthora megakarya]
MAAISKLSFPKTKRGMQQSLGALKYYTLQTSERRRTSSITKISKQKFRVLRRKVAEEPILRHFDDKKEVHVMLYANEWRFVRPSSSCRCTTTSYALFGYVVIKDAEIHYYSGEKEVLALLLLLNVCYTQLTGKTLHVYTRYPTLAWVHKSKCLFGRAVQFAVLLSSCLLEDQRIREKDCLFSKLLQSRITNFVDATDETVTERSDGSQSTECTAPLMAPRRPKRIVDTGAAPG